MLVRAERRRDIYFKTFSRITANTTAAAAAAVVFPRDVILTNSAQTCIFRRNRSSGSENTRRRGVYSGGNAKISVYDSAVYSKTRGKIIRGRLRGRIVSKTSA